jgi:hypothetical protein
LRCAPEKNLTAIIARNFFTSPRKPHPHTFRGQCVRAHRIANRRDRTAKKRGQRKKFRTRKKKFVDAFPQVHYAHNATRVMTFNTHSQQFPVTRCCGLKGGIIHGD